MSTNKGKEFENLVAELYKRRGFAVGTNKLMKGNSGTVHEIDVYAEKKGFGGIEKLLIECKYRNHGETIGKIDVANFLLKLDDLRFKEGLVITNAYFSEHAILVAKNYSIELVDGESFSELCHDYGVHAPKFLCRRCDDPLSYMISSAVDFFGDLGIFKKLASS